MAGGSTQDLKERVAKLEAILGVPLEGHSSSTLCERVATAQQDVVVVQKSLEEKSSELLQLMEEHAEETAALHVHRNEELLEQIEALRDEIKGFSARYEAELMVIKKAIIGTPSGGEVQRKVRVPEPKPFTGTRSAKELENFLWDMEQYFKAAHIPAEEQVTITTMYLMGDAKLWWRTRLEDGTNAGKPLIKTWSELREELKVQFLPCNTAWVARDALRKLKHTSTVREYVKQFSSLMLGIKDMSEADKLYNFMSGLQEWAQRELRSQGIQEINAAMAAADRLLDFRQEKDEGERQPKFKGKGQKNKGKEADAGSKGEPKEGQKQFQGKRDFGCFICGGPHRAKECPRKEQLGALEIQEEEEGEPVVRMNPLQVRLNALQVLALEEEVPPCDVQAVDVPQEKGTSWDSSLTASQVKQGLEQGQKLEKIVARKRGQKVETSGQAEAMWKQKLPQIAWRKDRVKAPENSSTSSTRTSNSRGVGGLSRP
jgi:hypothetical protein